MVYKYDWLYKLNCPNEAEYTTIFSEQCLGNMGNPNNSCSNWPQIEREIELLEKSIVPHLNVPESDKNVISTVVNTFIKGLIKKNVYYNLLLFITNDLFIPIIIYNMVFSDENTLDSIVNKEDVANLKQLLHQPQPTCICIAILCVLDLKLRKDYIQKYKQVYENIYNSVLDVLLRNFEKTNEKTNNSN
jgi:hypothetical protein